MGDAGALATFLLEEEVKGQAKEVKGQPMMFGPREVIGQAMMFGAS